MKITGTFESTKGKRYRVDVQDAYPNTDVQTCGEDNIYLAGDSVEITREIDDLFQPIIIHSCKISYYTKDYQGGNLFTVDPRGVEIYIRDITASASTIIYHGWANPQIFNQGYTNFIDGFTLDATDDLGSLQYVRYKDVDEDNYDTKVKTATMVTVKDIFKDITNRFLGTVNKVWYDNSVTLSGSSDIFADISIDEYLFYKEDAENTLTYYQVFERILRFFNLHAMQIGDITYLFNWKKLKEGQTTTWTDLSGNTHTLSASQLIDITGDMHAAADTNITVDEAFNKVAVKAVIDDSKDVIDNPLDANDLQHLYDRQLYMEEWSSEIKRTSADAYYGLYMGIVGGDIPTNSRKDLVRYEWYMQHVYNTNWKFYTYSALGHARKEINEFAIQGADGRYKYQYNLPATVYDNPCSCGMFKFGKVEEKFYTLDNSPQSKLEMTPYICISINGNGDNSESGHTPSDETLRISSPIAEYFGPQNGSIFSPQSSAVTNYIVFSGDILLQTTVQETADYNYVKNYGHPLTSTGQNLMNQHFVFGIGDQGRYYARRWFTMTYPDGTDAQQAATRALMPPVDGLHASEDLKYNYSANGDGEDRFWKLPILECEMIIGDKRLIETDMDEYGHSTLSWVKLGEEPVEEYVDESGNTQEYTVTTFTIGVNPKIDDNILNTMYPLQNTVLWNMNIDATGMAVPVTYDDELSGDITFKILGPINLTWDNITRRHPSFWRHTKWYHDTIFVLAQTETIFIKNFSAKLYSSLGTEINQTGKDLIYTSAEDDYINAKKAQDFDLITQPSLDTCIDLGIEYRTAANAFVNNLTGLPLTEITADGETDIAERLYVNHYYNELHQPKIELNGTYYMREDSTWRNRYHNSLLNKDFYIKKETQNLKFDNAYVTFREV